MLKFVDEALLSLLLKLFRLRLLLQELIAESFLLFVDQLGLVFNLIVLFSNHLLQLIDLDGLHVDCVLQLESLLLQE